MCVCVCVCVQTGFFPIARGSVSLLFNTVGKFIPISGSCKAMGEAMWVEGGEDR